MGWKNWPYWLRGGIITTLIFSIIIVPSSVFCENFFSDIHGIEAGDKAICNIIHLIFIIPNTLILILIFPLALLIPKLESNFETLMILAYLILSFIIGAIIGLIVGKIKSKKEVIVRQ